MAVVKCPICEINYMKEGEPCCQVCQRERNRRCSDAAQEDVEMCIECGEYPAEPGEELCARCLAEQRDLMQEKNALGKMKSKDSDDEQEDDNNPLEIIPLDLVAEAEEVVDDDEIPQDALAEIDSEYGSYDEKELDEEQWEDEEEDPLDMLLSSKKNGKS